MDHSTTRHPNTPTGSTVCFTVNGQSTAHAVSLVTAGASAAPRRGATDPAAASGRPNGDDRIPGGNLVEHRTCWAAEGLAEEGEQQLGDDPPHQLGIDRRGCQQARDRRVGTKRQEWDVHEGDVGWRHGPALCRRAGQSGRRCQPPKAIDFSGMNQSRSGAIPAATAASGESSNSWWSARTCSAGRSRPLVPTAPHSAPSRFAAARHLASLRHHSSAALSPKGLPNARPAVRDLAARRTADRRHRTPASRQPTGRRPRGSAQQRSPRPGVDRSVASRRASTRPAHCRRARRRGTRSTSPIRVCRADSASRSRRAGDQGSRNYVDRPKMVRWGGSASLSRRGHRMSRRHRACGRPRSRSGYRRCWALTPVGTILRRDSRRLPAKRSPWLTEECPRSAERGGPLPTAGEGHRPDQGRHDHETLSAAAVVDQDP